MVLLKSVKRVADTLNNEPLKESLYKDDFTLASDSSVSLISKYISLLITRINF